MKLYKNIQLMVIGLALAMPAYAQEEALDHLTETIERMAQPRSNPFKRQIGYYAYFQKQIAINSEPHQRVFSNWVMAMESDPKMRQMKFQDIILSTDFHYLVDEYCRKYHENCIPANDPEPQPPAYDRDSESYDNAI